jgi:hypothetical protein
MGFSKLVRYRAGDQVAFGELIEASETEYTVKRLDGTFETGFQSTLDEVVKVKSVWQTCTRPLRCSSNISRRQQLLCPVERAPIVICIGLNYQRHAKEANVSAHCLPSESGETKCYPAYRSTIPGCLHQASRCGCWTIR